MRAGSWAGAAWWWSVTGSRSSATPRVPPGRWPASWRSRNVPRCSCVRDDDENTTEGRQERVVVANADSWSSSARWPTRHRVPASSTAVLVAAYDAEIDPLLCLTKADLAGPQGATCRRRSADR